MCGACCQKEGKNGDVCEYLSEPDKDGMKVCKIYGTEERPLKCWLFPELPPILFPDCGFWFIDRYDGGRTILPGQI